MDEIREKRTLLSGDLLKKALLLVECVEAEELYYRAKADTAEIDEQVMAATDVFFEALPEGCDPGTMRIDASQFKNDGLVWLVEALHPERKRDTRKNH